MGFRPPQTRLFSPLSPPVDNGDGTSTDEWFVLRARGREALSQLYEVELTFQTTLDMVTPYDDDTLARYLDTNWTLQTLQEVHADEGDGSDSETYGVVAQAFHGVFRELEMLPVNARGQSQTPIAYRAVLVPRVWYATQTVRTRIFQGMTVPEIIAHVLEDTGLSAGDDFELRTTVEHAMREYTLQHDESDHAFISRLAEHEGLFYFFEQAADRERIVFADHNAFQPFEALSAFGFDHVRHDPTPKANHPAIRSLRRVIKKVPRAVTTLDYDHRAPRVNPQANAEVSPHGIGMRQYYLHNREYTLTDRPPAEDPTDQATRLAHVRAEELAAPRDRLHLHTTVLGLFSGMTFTLENHFDDGLVWAGDQRRLWLVVEASFEIDQDPLRLSSREAASGTLDFESHLVVQDHAVAWRAPRTTPRPVVAGVLNARVHDLVKGPGADLDPAGQYTLLFDVPTLGAPEYNGGTMRRFRMAQTFSGPGYGMHHPLHIGAEVLVAHLGGDPDRPVIVGSPPNADNTTPITQTNPTHGGFKTRNGVVVYTNDDA
jgi:type VI secretion system secreted protein VgrG